jgi:dihydrodipicolinate synthase/N-acetylneuraminate lyase
VLPAALTPLRDGGAALDEEAIGPYVEFLVTAGVDGLLALGTTGEGILLSADERRRAATLFVQAAAGRVDVAVHTGAQTTADTVALTAHATEAGADAVAVIGPPYYALDEPALTEHFVAAAAACEPLPFYLYEFRARTGYSIPAAVLAEVRERAPNLRGLKVSNQPWEAVEPFLVEGLDVFIGAESLLGRGLAQGAAGAVSGLAAAFPELVVEAARGGSDQLGRTRAAVERYPFQAALKHVVATRGVPMQPDVRAPLRGLTPEELAGLEQWLASS